jgi:hypothetical protein
MLHQNGITTLNDVKAFVKAIKAEGTLFHPDDAFEQYVHIDTGKPVYTEEEARLRNSLSTACFEVCEREKADFYETGMKAFYGRKISGRQFM